VRLLLATRNPHKVAELRQLFAGTGWRLCALSDLEGAPEVEEDGGTFLANARKKARVAAAFSKMWTLAEDAGLEVDALDGAPGVRSARYCGEGAHDSDKVRRVLDQIVAVPDERRTARFRCVMCLVDPAGTERVFEGTCEGRVAHHARGTAGFGYDPIFMPDGYSKTFGELGQTVKSQVSHRANAVRQVLEYLKTRVRHGHRVARSWRS
jgi:XTP/dITP diphosphohydrolase